MISVCGQQIRVDVRPGTSARPLVLCNGIGANLELLQPFVDALDREIEVVRFDVPGVGGSPLPLLPYNFASLAVLLGKLLDRLGYDDVDILGLSWGGGLAQQFAFHNPRRCRRLVLAATATGMLMVPAHPRVLAKMITPRRYTDPAYAKSIAAHLYGGRLRLEPNLAAELIHPHDRVGSHRGYLLQLAAGLGWSSLPMLPLIRQPTLILAGNDDPIIPMINARVMRRLLPLATLHSYEDGHLGLLTDSARLATVVDDFLLGANRSPDRERPIRPS